MWKKRVEMSIGRGQSGFWRLSGGFFGMREWSFLWERMDGVRVKFFFFGKLVDYEYLVD